LGDEDKARRIAANIAKLLAAADAADKRGVTGGTFVGFARKLRKYRCVALK
jgi:hypothetical protein